MSFQASVTAPAKSRPRRCAPATPGSGRGARDAAAQWLALNSNPVGGVYPGRVRTAAAGRRSSRTGRRTLASRR
jgi:hypothetical protein